MSRIKKLALALGVLVAVAGFLGFLPPSEPSYGPPKTGPHSVWTPSPTTTAPTTTTASDVAPRVGIGSGTFTNETVASVYNVTVPAEFINVKIRRTPAGGATYAIATNCSAYREPAAFNYSDTPSWNIATNRTHSLSEWEIVRVARVDTQEVVATHRFNRTPADCEPPIPDPEAAE